MAGKQQPHTRMRQKSTGSGLDHTLFARKIASLTPDEQRTFLLKNMNVLEQLARDDGQWTVACERAASYALDPNKKLIDCRSTCPSCRAVGVLRRTRLESTCEACGAVFSRITDPRTVLSATTFAFDAEGAHTQLKTRKRSVYSAQNHFNEFIQRILANTIPALSAVVWQRLEAAMAPFKSHFSRSGILSLYSFWFELMRSDPKLRVFYHYIPYIISCYEPQSICKLSDAGVAALARGFAVIYRRWSEQAKAAIGSARHNLIGYGYIIYRLVFFLPAAERERGLALLYRWPEILRPLHRVPAVQTTTGSLLARICNQYEREIRAAVAEEYRRHIEQALAKHTTAGRPEPRDPDRAPALDCKILSDGADRGPAEAPVRPELHDQHSE